MGGIGHLCRCVFLVSLISGSVLAQDKPKPKKKWDEASQHPRSELKRVVFARVKAEGVESDCEGQSDGRHDNPPAQ